MINFKLDMHVHTDEVSRCGRIAAKKVVNLYKDSGYDGLVITDHYYKDFFVEQNGLSWEEKIENYLEGYYQAQKVGTEVGLNVILGIELRFITSPNDYLVYGITPKFLKENPRLYQLGLKRFRKLIEGKDILIYQAHPYRNGLDRAEPTLLDGIEVFNGNPRHNSRNELAYQFAKENDLAMISGSDFHELEELAQGGIVVPQTVDNAQKLVEVLKKENIELITTDDFRKKEI